MSLITVNNIIVVTYCSKCHRLSLSLIAVNGITLVGRPYSGHPNNLPPKVCKAWLGIELRRAFARPPFKVYYSTFLEKALRDTPHCPDNETLCAKFNDKHPLWIRLPTTCVKVTRSSALSCLCLVEVGGTSSCLLLIDKVRATDKIYIWLSVWWKTKPKDEESTCRTYTGLFEELEYLKIETRLIDEKFASVMGECVI